MLIPIGFIILMIPNKPCEHCFILARILPDPNKLPRTHPQAEAEHWDDTIECVRDNLTMFAILHGGRVCLRLLAKADVPPHREPEFNCAFW